MQVSSEIIAVLDKVANYMGTAIDWTKDNVLAYIQELMGKYVSYKLYISTVWFFVAVLVTILLSVWLALRIYKVRHSEEYDMYYVNFWVPTYIMILIGVLVFGCLAAFTYLNDILQCITIPEKVFFDYVMGYIE